jgi:hypothetical protein
VLRVEGVGVGVDMLIDIKALPNSASGVATHIYIVCLQDEAYHDNFLILSTQS